MEPRPLTPKQARFVAEYLVDLNATQAAIRAGYSPKTAEQQGPRLLGVAGVSAAIAKGQQRIAAKVEVTAETVLRELLQIATTDIGEAFDEHGGLKPLKDIPVNLRRAISSVEVEQTSVEGTSVGTLAKLKLWDKNAALVSLGKHLKLFTDKLELSADSSFADLLKEARARARQK